MASVFTNGGIIGTTLDYGANNSNDRYVVSITSVRDNLTFVGSQTLGYTGTTTNSNVTFSLTGGVAVTPAAKDLVLIAVSVGTNNAANPPIGVRGYTAVNQNLASDTQSTKFGVYYKLMGNPPDTSFERPATGNTQHAGSYSIHVWRNVDQNVIFDTTSTTITGTNTVVPNPPAITPTTTNTRIIVAAGGAHLVTSPTYSAAYLSNFVNSSGADNVDTTTGMGWVAWTSGSYDPAAWTFSGTDSTQYSYVATTMALRPQLIDIPTFGNLKNSGIWNLESVYEYKRSQYTPPGDILWTAGGTTYWQVPPGVSNVSAVVIGAGGGGSGGDGGRGTTNGGGGGGGCAWGNFDVTPGEILTIVVGAPGAGGTQGNSGTAGGPSSISRGATVLLSGGGGAGGIERNAGTASGGTSTGTVRQGGGTGGNGGTGSAASGGTGGGGAGGILGNGGNGGAYNAAGSNGGGTAGGGGGGGGGGAGTGTSTSGNYAGAGGGTNVYGSDYTGTGFERGLGGTFPFGDGQGGSGGNPGSGGYGGVFGGGGGGLDDSLGAGLDGGQAVVRIMWGSGRINRSYPSSNTGAVGWDFFI